MHPHTAIQLENISKQYRLGMVGTGTLSHDLKRWWTMNVLGQEDPFLKIGEENRRDVKGSSDYVWALKDINLEIEQGDVVGIIGKNGAGKSTLLKLLSRVTKPTTGTIKYRGRLASLLEVGTGFHPEMTGRENIYMNGSIMGMTRREITRKLDEIIAFAGVERYIDTPVKRYSSGMTVRLGFSIAAHLEPEILVVDEVLAVGDAEFQKKAIGKMQDVSKGGGRTVLFVSHNMAAITQLCTMAVLLENGCLIIQNDVDLVISKYLDGQIVKSHYLKETPDENDRDAYFKEIRITDQDGKDKNDFFVDEAVYIRFHLKIKKNRHQYNLFCMILDKRLNRVFAAESKFINEMMILKINSYFLTRGSYSIHTSINIPRLKNEDELENICRFNIIDNKTIMAKHGTYDYGNVFGKYKWLNENE